METNDLEKNSGSGTDYEMLYEDANPSLVSDPAKAETMAYATRPNEEAVVAHKAEAEAYLDKVGGTGYESGPAMVQQAENALDKADAARATADERADKVAQIYDDVKELGNSSGVQDRVEDPTRAQVEANAIRPQEEAVVAHKAAGLEYLPKTGGEGYFSGPAMLQQAEKSLGEAQAARQSADAILKKVDEVYAASDTIGAANDGSDRIENPAKAEMMARATSNQEEAVVELKGQAADYMAKTGGEGYHSGPAMIQEAEKKINVAKAKSAEADTLSEQVGNGFDRLNKR